MYAIEYVDPDGRAVRELVAARHRITRGGVTYAWTGGGHKIGAGYPPRLGDDGMIWTYVPV
ncbi:hypothetical protein [Cellulomonas triticagri]|uniref:Uncharacterized protein n=1 Tax=Cellulomonas triticagri TaxID=2483352 RepID=A0A3M2JJY6_9CELL|nr:hypothetical protein [Cellulomonas triticagri]RMI12516.1 hypothetical protein EBM89_08380 [Cellulomonas triticagri]